jgi:hypothetical protein
MMKYDSLNGESYEEESPTVGKTLGEIMAELKKHPSAGVRFINTDYTIIGLMSWRGSYDTPAIQYGKADKVEYQDATDCYKILRHGLNKIHSGYKGGEYKYHTYDTPYLTSCSSEYSCYQIVDFKYDVDNHELILVTKIMPY